MRSSRNALILILVATTIGGAALAWRQYGELVELRAVAMNREERADFNRRIWDLEKANRELRDQLAALQGNGTDELDSLAAAASDEAATSAEGEDRGESRGRRRGPFQSATAVRDLMSRPEIQAMLNAQQKARIEQNYAALFRKLNLSPEQAEKLTTLLAERLTTRMDVLAAAHAEGISPRDNPEAFRKLMTDMRDQLDSSIKSVIGDGGFAQLQNFEQTFPQRSIVNDLQQRLSYSDTPLTRSQAEQLVQILAANTPQRPMDTTVPAPPGGRVPIEAGLVVGMMGAGPGGGVINAVFDGGRGVNSAPVSEAALNQAQAVLSQPQLAALQQLQQQQQAQQELARVIRETVTNAQPGTSTGGAVNGGGGGRRTRPGGG